MTSLRAVLDQLRPVLYKTVTVEQGDRDFTGFILEEVAEAGGELLGQYTPDGTPMSLIYERLTALLVQDHHGLARRIAALEAAGRSG